NIVRGVPLDAEHEYVGSLVDLLNPYALLGGLATLSLFVLHGAVFLALTTTGDVRARARRIAGRAVGAALVAGGAFLLLTQLQHGKPVTWATVAVAALALVGVIPAHRKGHEGWAFVATGVAIVSAVVTLFLTLFPAVLPSTLDAAYSLTTTNAAATPYTLTIMSVVALICTPVVLAYQAWTYWVFRKRIGVEHIPAVRPEPASVASAASSESAR